MSSANIDNRRFIESIETPLILGFSLIMIPNNSMIKINPVGLIGLPWNKPCVGENCSKARPLFVVHR